MTTEAAADFPVTWDDPADAQKCWHYDREHMPLALSPLGFELALSPFLQGFGWGMTPIQQNYYTFFSLGGPRENSAPLTADVAYLQEGARCWHEEILPEVLRFIEQYRTPDFDAMSDEELVSEIERLREVRFRSGQLHTLSITPHWLGHRLLIDTYKELIADDELAALRLAQGYRNKSVEAGERLWEVTQVGASTPGVRERLLQTGVSPVECFAELERTPEARPFVDAFRAFLDEFGWRTGSDFSGPTWIEDSSVPLSMLRTYLEMPDYDPAAEHRRLVDERDAAIREAMAQLDAGKQAQLQDVVDAVRGVAALSEDHNFFIDQRLATMPRRLLLAAGRRLVSRGTLADPELVFFLRTPELIDALRTNNGSLQERAAERTRELSRWRTVRPPSYIGAAPPEGAPAERDEPLPSDGEQPSEFRGLAASAGVARGPVRVLTAISQAGRLRPGDVLVVPVTSPPWTPLFAVACAIVTEVGGSLSHTAVVAREYSLPAVVNVRNATRLLRDGQLVEVDGSAGIVRVLQ